MSLERQQGMTLVEVMVASVIFALVMMALVSAMRTLAQSYERLQTVTGEAAQIREVERFIRQTLQSAQAGEGYFEGGPSEIRWVAPLDRVGSAGGLQHLRVARRGDQLVLSFAPVLLGEEASDSPAWGAVIEDFVLLENLARLDIRYQVDPSQPWADRAAEGDSGYRGDSFLPRAVSINWALTDQELPPVTVQIDASGVGW